MPLAEAKSLLNHAAAKDPSRRSFILEHDRMADLEALQQLAWALERFSPVIGLEQDFTQTDNRKRQKNNAQFQPGSLLMDVTGLSHLFGGFESLAQQVCSWCLDLGYVAHVAIADTAAMAWGVAHFNPDCRHDRPWVIDEVAQDTAEVMESLSVFALRLAPQTSQTLQRLGIETIGQLMRLDRGDLRSRLGAVLLKRLDQMIGAIDEPIVVCQQEADFSAEEFLEYATSHRETIEVVVGRLVADLCQQLQTQQLGGLQWIVRLVSQTELSSSDAPTHPVEIRVSLFQPTADSAHVMPMVAMQLEQALLPHLTAKKNTWRKLPACDLPETKAGSLRHSSTAQKNYRYTTLQVQRIVVEVASCVRIVARQRHLFDEAPGLNQEALCGLINRLSSRLGAANVVYPVLRKGAQPECSVAFKPLVDPLKSKKRARTPAARSTFDAPTFSHVMGRPLKLIHPPLAVEVQRAAVEADDAKDVAFLAPVKIALANRHVNQTPQPIVRSWGPERIETGWWRGVMIRRDYWRIVTEKGQLFWVFFDFKTQQWFLHGEF